MAHPKSTFPRGTNQHPFTPSPIPFNPLAPFVAATLGVAKHVSAAILAWDTTYHHMLAAEGLPRAQPADCTVAQPWYQELTQGTDLVQILPYCVGFNAGVTAYAAPGAGESYSLQIWGVRSVATGLRNLNGRREQLFSRVAVPVADLQFTSGPQMSGGANAGDPLLPSSSSAARGRFMTTGVASVDVLPTPGIRFIGGGAGIVTVLFDALGFEGLLLYPHGMPADRGFGWMLTGV